MNALLYKLGLAMALAAISLAAADLTGPESVLEIVPVEGEHAVHDSRFGGAARTVVEVRDATGRPVPGVEVAFSAPEIGPSGRFSDGSRKQSQLTDAEGRAALSGFRPNTVEGEFPLMVRAKGVNGRGQDVRGSIVLRHANSSEKSVRTAAPKVRTRRSGGFGKKLLIIAGVGAAITAASIAATGGSPSAAPATPGSTAGGPVTITLGDIQVGAPQ